MLNLNRWIDVVDVKPRWLAYLEPLRKIKLELTVILRCVLTGAIDGDLLAGN